MAMLSIPFSIGIQGTQRVLLVQRNTNFSIRHQGSGTPYAQSTSVMGFSCIKCMVNQSFPPTLSVHQDHHAQHWWQTYHGHVPVQTSRHSHPSHHSHWLHPWGNPPTHRGNRRCPRSSPRQAPSHQVTVPYFTQQMNSPTAMPTTTHTAEWLYRWQRTNPYVRSDYPCSAHHACQCNQKGASNRTRHHRRWWNTTSRYSSSTYWQPCQYWQQWQCAANGQTPTDQAQLCTCAESHLINMVIQDNHLPNFSLIIKPHKLHHGYS